MKNEIRVVAGRARLVGKLRGFAFGLSTLVLVLTSLTFASSAAWAVGLTKKPCAGPSSGTFQAYLCKGDILVADGNAGPGNSGRIVLIDPVTGGQTLVAEGPPY